MRLWAIAAAGVLFVGCANRGLVRFEKVSKSAGRQDFAATAELVRKQKDWYGGASALLWHLDQGVLYHYADMSDSSIVHFAKAFAIHDELFAKSVTNEAASFLTNDNIRPYRGKPFEITAARCLQAMNYLVKGDPDGARVEMRQADLFLAEVARKAGNDKEAYRDDGFLRTLASIVYEMTGDRDDALISLYKAIRAYRAAGEKPPSGLLSYAYRAFMSQGREDDARQLELKDPGPAGPGEPVFGQGQEIVLFAHLGKSAALGQQAFWGTWVRDGMLVFHTEDAQGRKVTQALPAPGLPPRELEKASKGRPTRSGTTLHIKFALPAYREVKSRASYATLSVDGKRAETETASDLSNELESYLEENRGSILARTVARVVLRTIASQKTKDALNTGNPLLNLFLNIGTDALSDQLEQADARTWFLLPHTFEMTRLAVSPGTHSVRWESRDGRGQILDQEEMSVKVEAGKKAFIVAPSWR